MVVSHLDDVENVVSDEARAVGERLEIRQQLLFELLGNFATLLEVDPSLKSLLQVFVKLEEVFELVRGRLSPVILLEPFGSPRLRVFSVLDFFIDHVLGPFEA